VTVTNNGFSIHSRTSLGGCTFKSTQHPAPHSTITVRLVFSQPDGTTGLHNSKPAYAFLRRSSSDFVTVKVVERMRPGERLGLAAWIITPNPAKASLAASLFARPDAGPLPFCGAH
jgi:hypothetical protein